MKSYRLVEAGLTKTDIPVFKFQTELHEGVDLEGKFHIQFAAVQKGEEVRFAVNSPQGLLGVFGPKESRRVARALVESGEYIICANYANRDWETEQEYGIVLMGRDVGRDVDYREQYTLESEEHAAVEEIATELGVYDG